MTLQERYNNIIIEYIEAFLIKHDFHYNGILTDYDYSPLSNCIDIADYIVFIDDIMTDIDEYADKDEYFAYYHAVIETENTKFNYKSWLKGFRPETLKVE